MADATFARIVDKSMFACPLMRQDMGRIGATCKQKPKRTGK
ncbi:hypothetical protein [Roseovarius gahaiensis]|nr:hypothetical protein [Roseovarius gahaiensis]